MNNKKCAFSTQFAKENRQRQIRAELCLDVINHIHSNLTHDFGFDFAPSSPVKKQAPQDRNCQGRFIVHFTLDNFGQGATNPQATGSKSKKRNPAPRTKKPAPFEPLPEAKELWERLGNLLKEAKTLSERQAKQNAVVGACGERWWACPTFAAPHGVCLPCVCLLASHLRISGGYLLTKSTKTKRGCGQ